MIWKWCANGGGWGFSYFCTSSASSNRIQNVSCTNFTRQKPGMSAASTVLGSAACKVCLASLRRAWRVLPLTHARSEEAGTDDVRGGPRGRLGAAPRPHDRIFRSPCAGIAILGTFRRRTARIGAFVCVRIRLRLQNTPPVRFNTAAGWELL